MAAAEIGMAEITRLTHARELRASC